MRMYPVFLSLQSFSFLVIGAGKVGFRKVAALCEAGAGEVLVLDSALTQERAEELQALGQVRTERRALCEEDLAGKLLVFAATNCREENARIAGICRRLHVPCNVADAPEEGSFQVPATVFSGGVLAAFSTGGQSPALAARIREEAMPWVSRYSAVASFMGRLRPLVMGLGLSSDENATIFRALAWSELGEALCRGDVHAARTITIATLPPALHGHIEELLHGIG